MLDLGSRQAVYFAVMLRQLAMLERDKTAQFALMARLIFTGVRVRVDRKYRKTVISLNF